MVLNTFDVSNKKPGSVSLHITDICNDVKIRITNGSWFKLNPGLNGEQEG